MRDFAVGMWVETQFGKGKIVALGKGSATVEIERNFGRVTRLRVNFSKMVPVVDTFSEKELSSKAATDPVVNISLPSPERIADLRALHSLRFGLVPYSVLPDLTCGFSELETWIKKFLPKGPKERPVVLKICGPYGTGKSHTMAAVRWIAKQAGYVTARVEVDGKNVSLSDPKNLLSNLWQSLGAKNLHSDTPLLTLYHRALSKGYGSPHFRSRNFGLPNRETDRIADNFHTVKLLQQKGLLDKYDVLFDAVLSCHDEVVPSRLQREIRREDEIDWRFDNPFVRPMIGRGVAARPNDFIESLFGHGHICHAAGYKGLVVTIDEFEIELIGARQRVKRTLELLIALLTYFEKNPSAPVLICFATIETASDKPRSERLIDALVAQSNGDCHELREMEWADIEDLGRRMQSLYYRAYKIPDVRPAPDIGTIWNDYSRSLSGKARSFIKHYMAALDARFGPPNGLGDE